MVGGLQLLSILLLAGNSFAAPSFSSGNLDSLSLVPIGGHLDLRGLNALNAPSLEIRGVVGGRKKRFVVVRAEEKDACCPDSKCSRAKNEITTKGDCKCKTCPAGTKPNTRGDKCEKSEPNEEDNCPKGKKRQANGQACEKECPAGEKPGANGKCEKANDADPKKKGKYPEGQILDPAEGGQDELTEKPVCVPDDSKKCPAGQVPGTRDPGDMDPNKKVECGKEPEEKDKAKCDEKRQYKKVQIQPTLDSGNKAVEFCERTRKYERGKNKKIDEIKPKKQQKWDSEKDEREKKKKEEEEKKKKEEEEKKKKQEEMKKKEMDSKKKTRIGRCLPLAAFLDAGMAQISAKRDLEEIEARNTTLEARDGIDSDNPWEWTTEYFDEDFLQTDEMLDLWPSDIEFNPDIDIDNDDFVKYYTDAYQKHLDEIQREELKNSRPCGKNKRCIAKRGEIEIEVDEGPEVEVEKGPVEVEAEVLDERGEPVEKRFFQIIPAILAFLGRAASIAVRFIPRIAQVSTRLGNILKDQARLFRVAAPGKGASVQGMRQAAQQIVKSPYFRSCIKGGKPT
ncbi:hypothetical protein K469DRAFT_701579 [Zopfia rhizophila CBS 207.26]|uniref:Uncharacterized protein n=1 Tax=Zopfia rhizophila CBS 207.26 TaxID=1314779 RepID=A0A6A6D9B0_9PEZI|nr:hypothetical protein K469DRAFT_701579 [Zopfia rhizophila CBS 207.26]